MKNLKIALAVLVGALAAGCYNDFDTPAPRKLYTDTDMTALGLEHVTIKEVKDYFGPISGHGYQPRLGDDADGEVRRAYVRRAGQDEIPRPAGLVGCCELLHQGQGDQQRPPG